MPIEEDKIFLSHFLDLRGFRGQTEKVKKKFTPLARVLPGREIKFGEKISAIYSRINEDYFEIQ